MNDHYKPIDKLMDCQHVKRWTLVHTTTPSTVASHSFNVAVLAMAIRKAMRNSIGTSEQEVCYYAMMHDVDEAETGDMPTPTKNAIRAAGVEPNLLYNTQGAVSKPEPMVARIIKAADLLENYLFISENGGGTRALAAASEVRGRLDRYLAGASADLATATRYVWHYVENRMSDETEERKRIAEYTERRRGVHETTLRLVMDRESRNIDRGP
jgi:5'-deoxynucleotidase YfbR-like HD superfamily hydrolase